jgi:hypothetical protein
VRFFAQVQRWTWVLLLILINEAVEELFLSISGILEH